MPWTVQRILVAVDLGDTTDRTCAVATELARAHGAELVFLHVYDVAGFHELQREAPALYLDQVLDNLRMQVRFRVGQLEERPAHFRVEVVPDGNVARAILDAAERSGADLIVMGTHGRTGLARVLLGSVAEAALRRSRIPVVVVPATPRGRPNRPGRPSRPRRRASSPAEEVDHDDCPHAHPAGGQGRDDQPGGHRETGHPGEGGRAAPADPPHQRGARGVRRRQAGGGRHRGGPAVQGAAGDGRGGGSSGCSGGPSWRRPSGRRKGRWRGT